MLSLGNAHAEAICPVFFCPIFKLTDLFYYPSIAQLNTCSVDFSVQLFDFSALQFCFDSF